MSNEDIKPSKPPAETYESVKVRAQRILDLRGRPPYTKESGPLGSGSILEVFPLCQVSDDELFILSEYVQYWLPFLVEKPR